VFTLLEIQQQILLNYMNQMEQVAVNVTSFSSAPTLNTHTIVVLSNVEGTFSAGEVVTGQTSKLL
jgi:hypothetical protein